MTTSSSTADKEVTDTEKDGATSKIHASEIADSEPQRKRGRPRKDVPAAKEEGESQRKRGRPKKELPATNEDDAPTKTSGDPDTKEESEPKRNRGRPRKDTPAAKDESDPQRKRGRPRKDVPAATEESGAQRKKGPPKKGPQATNEDGAPTKTSGDPDQDVAADDNNGGEVVSSDPAKQPELKRAKSSSALKRDKNMPLARSNTPRELMQPAQRVLRVISVNVAGLRSVLSQDAKSKTLRGLVDREVPDVLCINEHKLKEEDVKDAEEKLRELLPKEYATMHWACSTEKKGYSGVAILLRHASEGENVVINEPGKAVVTTGMGKMFEDDPIIAREGRVLTLELPDLFITATYVPNSGSELERLDYRTNRTAVRCWDGALTTYVANLSKSKPVVVVGDMNCGHRVTDIWNMYDRPDFPDQLAEKALEDQYVGLKPLLKSAGLTPQERESFQKILDEADLVDTFRKLHPHASGVFSYFSQRIIQNRPMNKGLRLDYVLASTCLFNQGGAAPRVLDSFVLDQDDLIADHAPIGCHISLPVAK